MKPPLLVALFFFSFSYFAKSQPSGREIVNQPLEWLSLNSNVKLNKYYGLAFDGQFRFINKLSSQQHMFRGGIELYLTSKLSVIPIGYAYIINYKYGEQPATYVNNEHRIYQQLFYKHSISRLGFNHRLRFEERFIQKHFKDANEVIQNEGYVNKQFRIRYRILSNIPLNKPKMEPKTFYVSIWDEAFISWGKEVTFHEPDQNRIFVGPGYQFTKNIAVQGGFFYQMLIKSNGAKQENNVGGLLQLNYNFDLSKS